MRKRTLLIGLTLIGLILIGSLVVGWVFLSSWIPTNGKALLIRQMERQWPVDISIGSVQISLLQGLLLEEVVIQEREGRMEWLSAPELTVAIGWWSLLSRNIVFRARAPIEAPARTLLSVSGQYRLPTRELNARLRTSEIPVDAFSPIVSDRLPPQLREGAIRLDVQVAWQPDAPLLIDGEVAGTRLTWVEGPSRSQADLTLDGGATGPTSDHPGWTFDLSASLRHGTVDGIPNLDTISQIEGTGRLTHERLEIERLQGTILGSLWRITGTLEPLTDPSLEIHFSSDLEIGPLAGVMLGERPAWQISGLARCAGVCRGPLRPQPVLDCQTRLILQNVSVGTASAAHAITGISGRLAYDLLANHMSVETLDMRLRNGQLSMSGSITHAEPASVDLAVLGDLDLGALDGWHPRLEASHELDGRVSLDLMIRGPLTGPLLSGQAVLHDVHVQPTGLPQPIERMDGTVILSDDRVELRGATLELDGHPMTLSGNVTDLRTVPRFDADLRFPNGTLVVSGRWDPEYVVIDAGELTVADSKIQLTGELNRQGSRPSRLTARGIFEPAELARLPLVRFETFDPSVVEGKIAVGLRYEGPLEDWKTAALTGQLGADHVRIREVPFDGFLLELEQAERRLRLRIPKTSVANGTLWGDAILDHQADATEAQVQLDVTNIQLDQLAHAIPYWRDRAISGSASAHTVFKGVWERRATWRGEGWLKASGSHLGDLPLLDKLFQGLFGALGDRLGLEELRRAQITDVSLRWKLAEEQVGTDDLRLGGLAGREPVAIYAKGRVGFDRTLDFVIEPEFTEGTILEAPSTTSHAQAILKAAGQLERFRRLVGRHRITGTIEDPQHRFETTLPGTLRQPVDLIDGLLDIFR